ncbi:MAG: FkbM family methyltransferase [Hyphomonas sp.]
MFQIFDKKQRKNKTLSAFIRSKRDTKLGCVSLLQKWGYFYFVPLGDSFYGAPRFGLKEIATSEDWASETQTDHPIFKAVNPTWVDAVNNALEAQAPDSKLLFLDVGLFVGMVSLHAAKHLHPHNTELICLEPNPANEAIARLNFKLNDVVATVVSAACSDTDGEVSFWVPNGSLISGRISSSPDRHTYTVKQLRISSVLRQYKSNFDYAVIKVDTEGAEWSVLKGIEAETLKKTLAIIVEYWPTEKLDYERYLIENYRVFDL